MTFILQRCRPSCKAHEDDKGTVIVASWPFTSLVAREISSETLSIVYKTSATPMAEC